MTLSLRSDVFCELSGECLNGRLRSVPDTENDRKQGTVPPLKVAVIGTGALGKEHARLYAEFAQEGAVKFVGVADTDAEVAQKVATRHDVPVFASLEDEQRAEARFGLILGLIYYKTRSIYGNILFLFISSIPEFYSIGGAVQSANDLSGLTSLGGLALLLILMAISWSRKSAHMIKQTVSG